MFKKKIGGGVTISLFYLFWYLDIPQLSLLLGLVLVHAFYLIFVGTHYSML
jgi:hypothetical protein